MVPPDHGALLRSPPDRTDAVLGVRVERGAVPAAWDAPVQWGGVLWADERQAVLRVPKAALWVSDGDRVVLDAPDEQDRRAFDYLVYSAAARLLLLQRRRFSLHASLVASPDGTSVAVSGESMAGKSTTVLELVRRGWRFSCDDVVEVRQPGAVAVPYQRPIHLSDRAAAMLGTDPAVGRALPGRGKRVYRIGGDLSERPLAAVIRLDVDQDVCEPCLTRLDPVAALVLLEGIGERLGISELPAYRADYVAWLGGLLRQVPVFRLSRPGSGDTVSAVADRVQEAVAALPQV